MAAWTQNYGDTIVVHVVLPQGVTVLPQIPVTVISSITVTGNKKTKDKIILREINFSEGDSIRTEMLPQVFKQSETNLLKLSLFNYVTITASEIEPGFAAVNINVVERWFFFPQLNITPHNGNINQWLRNPDVHKVDFCFGGKKYNFRGRRETLIFNFRRGFNNISEIGYANIAVDKKYRHLFATYASFKTQRDIVARSVNDEAEYHHFDHTAYDERKVQLAYTFRQDINISHTLNVSYRTVEICDSLALLNPDYLGAGATHTRDITTSYKFKIDNRSSSYYPLTGSFYELVLQKTGYLHDANDVYGFSADIRQYFSPWNRIYFAAQAYATQFTNNTPFFMRPNLGSKPEILEGYEHNIVYGCGISFLKTSYKFELIPTRIIHIKRVNLPKFNKIHFAAYLNLFANCGYVESNTDTDSLNNSLGDTFLASLGLGLDLITYYDKAFSIYATRNIQNQYYIGIGLKSFF